MKLTFKNIAILFICLFALSPFVYAIEAPNVDLQTAPSPIDCTSSTAAQGPQCNASYTPPTLTFPIGTNIGTVKIVANEYQGSNAVFNSQDYASGNTAKVESITPTQSQIKATWDASTNTFILTGTLNVITVVTVSVTSNTDPGPGKAAITLAPNTQPTFKGPIVFPDTPLNETIKPFDVTHYFKSPTGLALQYTISPDISDIGLSLSPSGIITGTAQGSSGSHGPYTITATNPSVIKTPLSSLSLPENYLSNGVSSKVKLGSAAQTPQSVSSTPFTITYKPSPLPYESIPLNTIKLTLPAPGYSLDLKNYITSGDGSTMTFSSTSTFPTSLTLGSDGVISGDATAAADVTPITFTVANNGTAPTTSVPAPSFSFSFLHETQPIVTQKPPPVLFVNPTHPITDIDVSQFFSGGNLKFVVVGLPDGLTLSGSTISGTSNHLEGGIANIVIIATNDVGATFTTQTLFFSTRQTMYCPPPSTTAKSPILFTYGTPEATPYAFCINNCAAVAQPWSSHLAQNATFKSTALTSDNALSCTYTSTPPGEGTSTQTVTSALKAPTNIAPPELDTNNHAVNMYLWTDPGIVYTQQEIICPSIFDLDKPELVAATGPLALPIVFDNKTPLSPAEAINATFTKLDYDLNAKKLTCSYTSGTKNVDVTINPGFVGAQILFSPVVENPFTDYTAYPGAYDSSKKNTLKYYIWWQY